MEADRGNLCTHRADGTWRPLLSVRGQRGRAATEWVNSSNMELHPEIIWEPSGKRGGAESGASLKLHCPFVLLALDWVGA